MYTRLLLPTAFLAALTITALTVRAKPDRDPPAAASRNWPMFGGTPSRNMVNLLEKNLPATWSVAEGKHKNIKWSANLGRNTFGSPVVADGRVFVPTNGREGNKAVLMALRETDGKLLWQNTHEHPKDFQYGSSMQGVASSAAVDGDFVFYLVPGCEIICADCETGKIHWRYDMVKELKVFPAQNCPVETPPLPAPLVVGDLVFVATTNGMDWGDGPMAPNAPSFAALHKQTGKLAWHSNLPGKNIIMGGWSSPTYANVNHVPQVIFAGGDGVIYSFVPETGKLLWKCDCLPNREKPQIRDGHSFVGTPVVVGARLYIGQGSVYPNNPKSSRFLCVDITKKGDVSLKSYASKDEANKDSALIWAFGGQVVPVPEKGHKVNFGRTSSTAAVHNGLVYIPENNGYLHCLDAVTGKQVWEHDFATSIWGSPLWVDGRILVGTEDGDIVIFAHGRTAKVLATIDHDELIQTTPIAANGVLYVMTRSKLFAIAAP